MNKIIMFYPKLEQEKNFHYFPISLLAVASKLLAEGHEVKIFDERIDPQSSINDLIEWADEIMVSAFTGYQISSAYNFIKYAKALLPDKKITVGGPHVSCRPEQTLAS